MSKEAGEGMHPLYKEVLTRAGLSRLERAIFGLSRTDTEENRQAIHQAADAYKKGSYIMIVGGNHLSPHDNCVMIEVQQMFQQAVTTDHPQFYFPAAYTFFQDDVRSGETSTWSRLLQELFRVNDIQLVPVMRPRDMKLLLKSGQNKDYVSDLTRRVNTLVQQTLVNSVSRNHGLIIHPAGGTDGGRRKPEDLTSLNGHVLWPNNRLTETTINAALKQERDIVILLVGFNGTHRVYDAHTEKPSDATRIRIALSLLGLPTDPVPGAHTRLLTIPFSAIRERCIDPKTSKVNMDHLHAILHPLAGNLLGPEERGEVPVAPLTQSLSFVRQIGYSANRIHDALLAELQDEELAEQLLLELMRG